MSSDNIAVVHMGISKDSHEQLVERARKENLSLSALIRAALVEHYGIPDDIEDAPPKRAFEDWEDDFIIRCWGAPNGAARIADKLNRPVTSVRNRAKKLIEQGKL